MRLYKLQKHVFKPIWLDRKQNLLVSETIQNYDFKLNIGYDFGNGGCCPSTKNVWFLSIHKHIVTLLIYNHNTY